MSSLESSVQNATTEDSDEKSIQYAATPDSDSETSVVDRKAEKALVRRLDLIFLSVAGLGYIFKYLDQTNISNAYVSGMKEDLGLFGNELNLFTTYFNIGYVVMLFPSTIAVSWFGPGKWLPFCELCWGIVTCFLSVAKDAQTVYGLRFLVGFFEGSSWPGYFTVLGQWYLPHELALRMAIFNGSQNIGAMLSGALQGAISTNLSGHMGRNGWQWAFLVNGVCTIFVALLAFVALPGFPDRPNKLSRWYLTDKDIQVALARNARVKRSVMAPITFRTFFRAFTNWKLWAFALTFPFSNCTTPSGFMNLWLKSLKKPDGSKRYSVGQLNYIPIGGQAIGLVTQLGATALYGLIGRPLYILLGHSTVNAISQIILFVRPSSDKTYMAGWFLNFAGAAADLIICAWGASHLEDQPAARTIFLSFGTTLNYISNMFLPIVAFPAKEAPDWRIGTKLYLGFILGCTVGFIAIHFALKRESKKRVGL